MRSRLALVVGGLLLAASPVVFHRAPAAADNSPGSGLGGYRISSASAGVSALYNDGSEGEALIPQAATDAGTGTTHALATVLYPGPVGANPGATLKQFLGANVPPSVAAQLGTLTDPALAQAYGGGPNDSTFGGPGQAVNGTAHADGAGAVATGTIAAAGGATYAAVSTTKVLASSVTTTATGTVSDLTIGGVIHIARVTSTATASSDGKTGSASGSTEFSGVTVAGIAASLTSSGLTLGPLKIPLKVAALTNPALAGLGLSVQVSPEAKTINGAKATIHEPGVTFFFSPPGGIPCNPVVTQLPCGPTTFTVTLGGAEAEASAAPAFVADLGLPPVVPPPASTVEAVNTGGGGSVPLATGVTSEPTSDAGSAFSPPVAPPSSPAPSGPIGTLRAVAADYKGLTTGLLVLGLLASAAGAFGLGRIPDDVLAEKAASSPCPLDRKGPS